MDIAEWFSIVTRIHVVIPSGLTRHFSVIIAPPDQRCSRWGLVSVKSPPGGAIAGGGCWRATGMAAQRGLGGGGGAEG